MQGEEEERKFSRQEEILKVRVPETSASESASTKTVPGGSASRCSLNICE